MTELELTAFETMVAYRAERDTLTPGTDAYRRVDQLFKIAEREYIRLRKYDPVLVRVPRK